MNYTEQNEFNMQNDILLDVLSSYVNKKCVSENIQGVDWKYISSLAMEQGIGGILFKAIEKKNSVDENVYQRLSYYYEKSLYMCAARNEVLSRISSAFEKEEIDFLILKGAIIQGYYPSPELRVMSDIDFYIRNEDRKRAKKILESLEIYFLESNSYQDIYKTNNSVIVEIHHALWGYNLENTKLYSDIWSNSNLLQGRKHTYVLSDNDLYIFIIAHMLKHFKESGIGIRPLFDIWFVLKKSISNLDFNYINSQLSLFDAVDFEKRIRMLVKCIFLQKEMDAKLKLILDYLLKCKTHGTSDIAAINASDGKNKQQQVVSRIFPPLSQMKRRYLILEKIFVLLPFFWLWRILCLPFSRGRIKSNVNKITKIDSETQKHINSVFIAAGITQKKKEQKLSSDMRLKIFSFLCVIMFLIFVFCMIYFRNDHTGIPKEDVTSDFNQNINSENSDSSDDSEELISEIQGSEYGTISWKGGRYTGYLIDNIPNGSGEHIVENSFRYVGFFEKGLYEGLGKIEYSDGSYYEGEFKNNQANGQGTLYCANGDIINGVFSEGQPGGFCNYEYSDGNLFIGTMIKGLKHGEGTFYWLNGDKYVGSFVDDRRDGYGVLYYANGDIYSGNWSQGFCSGYGVYSWADGRKYEGNFEIGLMNDTNCTIYYPDGSEYNGEISDGIQNGKGQLTYSNGDIAKGNFSFGYLSGEAEYYFNEKKLWVRVIYEKGVIVKYILD